MGLGLRPDAEGQFVLRGLRPSLELFRHAGGGRPGLRCLGASSRGPFFVILVARVTILKQFLLFTFFSLASLACEAKTFGRVLGSLFTTLDELVAFVRPTVCL